MPTSAQLQAESYWGREIVTAEITWLGDQLCQLTGRPRDAFGSKGNAAHLRGAHRSQEWIQRSRYCTSRTYTVQGGLTATQARHVAGVDFTPGSVEEMIAQSRRLMAEVKAGRLEGVTEIFCNVDGDKVVDGWDNVRNRAATSDSSHLWHWHLSIDRKHCADRALMERILAIALGLEDDMDQNDPLEHLPPGDPKATVGWSLTDMSQLVATLAREPSDPKVAQGLKIEPDSVLDRLLKAAERPVKLSDEQVTALAGALPEDLVERISQRTADLLAARLAK